MRYSGLDDIERWSLPMALIEQGARQPTAPWIVMTDGDTLTFGAAADEARRVAGWLAGLGIAAGDRVAIMLPNGLDFIRAWAGSGVIGAVAVLLNPELRGAFLAHQLAVANVSLIIVGADLASMLSGHKGVLQLVAVAGSNQPHRQGVLRFEDWRSAAPYDGAIPSPQTTACIMFTSGTTGAAKGVLMPHRHCALYGIGALEAFQVVPDDRYYICLPLCHSNALLMQLGTTLLAGISAVIRPRFSASEWLSDIREHNATLSHLIGVLAAFVIAQPGRPDDRHHCLRAVLNGPNLAEVEAVLRERFGIADVISGFGMTEVNMPIWGRVGYSTPNAAGWVDARHFEVMVADPDRDLPVVAGTLGELLVRPKIPFGFMVGYLDMPEKAVEAWRNLWFHTGDAATMNTDGLVTFVGRLKDCIRRRGENIAADEIEAVVRAVPDVAEVAAFAVPSNVTGGEDEVMIVVVSVAGAKLDPETVGASADALLPRYAHIRFVEIAEAIPKTATGKIQRAILRQRGCADAFDRDSGSNIRSVV